MSGDGFKMSCNNCKFCNVLDIGTICKNEKHNKMYCTNTITKDYSNCEFYMAGDDDE
jgi:hypothetical protein